MISVDVMGLVFCEYMFEVIIPWRKVFCIACMQLTDLSDSVNS